MACRFSTAHAPAGEHYCRVTDLIAANTATGGSAFLLFAGGGITAGSAVPYLLDGMLLRATRAAEMRHEVWQSPWWSIRADAFRRPAGIREIMVGWH